MQCVVCRKRYTPSFKITIFHSLVHLIVTSHSPIRTHQIHAIPSPLCPATHPMLLLVLSSPTAITFPSDVHHSPSQTVRRDQEHAILPSLSPRHTCTVHKERTQCPAASPNTHPSPGEEGRERCPTQDLRQMPPRGVLQAMGVTSGGTVNNTKPQTQDRINKY